MDFISRFLRTYGQCDFIMVVVDKLTKVAHLVLVRPMYSASDV